MPERPLRKSRCNRWTCVTAFLCEAEGCRVDLTWHPIDRRWGMCRKHRAERSKRRKAEYAKRYRAKHKQELVDRNRAWRQANPEHRRAYMREYMKRRRANAKAGNGGPPIMDPMPIECVECGTTFTKPPGRRARGALCHPCNEKAIRWAMVVAMKGIR